MSKELQGARQDYKQGELRKSTVLANPMDQFNAWFSVYQGLQIKDYNAMTLSTVSDQGQPSARIVLLKGLRPTGFEFFTNYNSHKGEDIAGNNKVSLLFFWKETEQQIRIEGLVEKLSKEDSEAYFNVRPRASKIGAWASNQSSVLENREELELHEKALDKKWGDEIPKPDHWGGYLVKPQQYEFWQGRSSRLHDRIRYQLLDNGTWEISRLAP